MRRLVTYWVLLVLSSMYHCINIVTSNPDTPQYSSPYTFSSDGLHNGMIPSMISIGAVSPAYQALATEDGKQNVTYSHQKPLTIGIQVFDS